MKAESYAPYWGSPESESNNPISIPTADVFETRCFV